MIHDVYLPLTITGIDPGSGIVARAVDVPDGYLVCDYESNRFNVINIRTFTDRVAQAADRQLTRYPTKARALLPRESLRLIGHYNDTEGKLLLNGQAEELLLASWLGMDGEVPSTELLATGFTHEARRAIDKSMASGDANAKMLAKILDARAGGLDRKL